MAEKSAVPAFQPPIDAINFTDGFCDFKAKKPETAPSNCLKIKVQNDFYRQTASKFRKQVTWGC